jgi:chemotaxis protein methyltransferase CheR
MELSRECFRKIAQVIRREAGLELPEGKTPLVRSRLSKRIKQLELDSFEAYCRLLDSEGGPAEFDSLITALTTNVTSFFREEHHFDDFAEHVLPKLRMRRGPLRLWSAGCSIGAEPYSLAAVILKHWPQALNADVKILATDVDRKALEKAQSGRYDAALVSKEVPDAFKTFFRPVGNQEFEVAPELKRLVTVRPLNFARQWPVKGPFQAVFCRNVVIYFDRTLTDQVWHRFSRVIEPGGTLYIGHSERISGSATRLFQPAGVTTYRLRKPPLP